jgi:hypothetical protein
VADSPDEDAIERFWRMLDGDPGTPVVGFERSAAGCRWMITRWERLERLLAADGTWYGMDRFETIQLQGLSAMVPNFYESEPARAEVPLQTLARRPDELALLRAQRSHRLTPARQAHYDFPRAPPGRLAVVSLTGSPVFQSTSPPKLP